MGGKDEERVLSEGKAEERRRFGSQMMVVEAPVRSGFSRLGEVCSS